MQQNAAQAYLQVGKRTGNPRDVEANLLSRSATQLKRIQDDWELERQHLRSALSFNSRLWRIFLSSATRTDNPLPVGVRQNIANLGLFVLSQTLRIEASPAADKLGVLISINREIAAGLRAMPG
jgi:flagellar biosynthesis activator protein FlaF